MSKLSDERIDLYHGQHIRNQSNSLPGHEKRMKDMCEREEERQISKRVRKINERKHKTVQMRENRI